MNQAFGSQRNKNKLLNNKCLMNVFCLLQLKQVMMVGACLGLPAFFVVNAQTALDDYAPPLMEYYRPEQIIQMRERIDELKEYARKKTDTSLARGIEFEASRVKSKIKNFEAVLHKIKADERSSLKQISDITLGKSFRLFFDVSKLPNDEYCVSKLEPFGLRLMPSSKNEKADAVVTEIKKLNNLRLISFENCTLSSSSISQLATMTNLNAIVFNCNITDQDVKLCISKLPSLKHLRFARCNMLRSSFLEELSKNSSIREMEWVNTFFPKEKLYYLLELDSLEYVYINGKEIRFTGSLDELNVVWSKKSSEDKNDE